MSHINIHHAHSLSPEQARQAVQEVAEKLSQRFGMEYAWAGNVLNFNRSGVDGHIQLEKEQLHVTAKLGFLLGTMKGPIEAEIKRVLDERFA